MAAPCVARRAKYGEGSGLGDHTPRGKGPLLFTRLSYTSICNTLKLQTPSKGQGLYNY